MTEYEKVLLKETRRRGRQLADARQVMRIAAKNLRHNYERADELTNGAALEVSKFLVEWADRLDGRKVRR